MAQAALVASAAQPIFSGLQARAQARAEADRAEINSYIGRTRALQTSASAKSALASERATLRATAAANGQRMGLGLAPAISELDRIRERERRIAYGNEMSRSADWRYNADAANLRGRTAFLTGLMQAGPSMFELYNLRSSGG